MRSSTVLAPRFSALLPRTTHTPPPSAISRVLPPSAALHIFSFPPLLRALLIPYPLYLPTSNSFYFLNYRYPSLPPDVPYICGSYLTTPNPTLPLHLRAKTSSTQPSLALDPYPRLPPSYSLHPAADCLTKSLLPASPHPALALLVLNPPCLLTSESVFSSYYDSKILGPNISPSRLPHISFPPPLKLLPPPSQPCSHFVSLPSPSYLPIVLSTAPLTSPPLYLWPPYTDLLFRLSSRPLHSSPYRPCLLLFTSSPRPTPTSSPPTLPLPTSPSDLPTLRAPPCSSSALWALLLSLLPDSRPLNYKPLTLLNTLLIWALVRPQP
ncbi:unnamed protein product [Dicrocoelium dendriticum]|nr:unnamed protein product [Dicrocoelium dendriticum]